MGSCLSKKSACASSSSPVALPNPPGKLKSDAQVEKKKVEEENVVKKEIFIIKHRKSHEIERQRSDEEKGEAKNAGDVVEKGKNAVSGNGGLGNVNGVIVGGGAPVRTSSCTKEEVDAILIQCGRLSRSSSTGKAALSSEKKYSGSKRSYDFDNENGKSDGNNADGDDEAVARERENRRRERHRQSQGRRRTPKGRETRRGSSGPEAEKEAAAVVGGEPGKMVSVPATVTSLAMDKSANCGGSSGGGGEGNGVAGVKRIQVKRNVGGDGAVGTRTGASPRARSPARARASNENQNVNMSQNQQQPISLSRSNSRKAESSPIEGTLLVRLTTMLSHRRKQILECSLEVCIFQDLLSCIRPAPVQKPNSENKTVQGTENRINTSSSLANVNCKNQEQQLMGEEMKALYGGIAGHVALNVISSGPENPKPHAVARSRSSRLSRDLDINPETPSNPNTSSYTALLLEDIQNFHQKSNPPPAFSLPPCVTKACSILEAVADLNSSTSSNLSSVFSEDRRKNPVTEQMNKSNENKSSSGVNLVGKTKPEIKDPILESEIMATDDLMEPSFHKYVTVRRGTSGGDDLEEEESSGSNSFVGSQQQWVSSSCWEPNSAESTDRWTSSSSRSASRQNDVSPVGFQRHAISEPGRGFDEGGKRMSATKKRDSDHQQNGIGRGKIGARGPHAVPAAAAT
ncbi:hypothetical protein Sango_0017900 [Sesamum angolense]|uniref:Uncharacterized protein n=1 Tax=Sesamum angolense TaxID=2727404 RepID=A0AAE1XCX3_9LAMI|nr:hypothetical protein Sango_0017900 [Sesamum angolense]